MVNRNPHPKNSHTRGAPLANIAGFCLILGEAGEALDVKELASRAIERGVIQSQPLQKGARFPTRINHHIISLRQLDLVNWAPNGNHVYYSLNQKGRDVYTAVKDYYSGSGKLELDFHVREALRPMLVASDYVRSQWLKYFMTRDVFSYEDLISDGTHITFCRVPPEQRQEAANSLNPDTGYRLISEHWDELILYEEDRREVQHGLRRWTNEVYLTDDRVLMEVAAPFSYLHELDSETDTFKIESHIVKRWLDPGSDLRHFEDLVHKAIDNRHSGDRITIPDLIIDLCNEYGYAKENVKELLTELFYERSSNFFFERGSKFLVDHAFQLSAQDKPSVYYLKLEGAWRTSLVRYGIRPKDGTR